MQVFLFISAAVALMAISTGAKAANPTPKEGGVHFGREILSVLSDRCYLCHGPDKQENDSRLD